MSHISKGDVHAFLDGALGAYPDPAARHVREHLDACRECAQMLEGERRLREEAAVILEASAPGPVELDPLEELVARAAALDGQRHDEGADRTERARPTLSNRIYSLRWAATIVVSLGAGWMARDLSGPAVVERGSVFDPAVTVSRVPQSTDEQREERDNASQLPEAETALESPAEVAADFAGTETPPELRGAVANEVIGGAVAGGAAGSGAVGGGAFGGGADRGVAGVDDDAPRDRLEERSARRRAQPAVAQAVAPADNRVIEQAERPVAPVALADEIRSGALAVELVDGLSRAVDAAPESLTAQASPAAQGPSAAPSLSTIPFLVPGLPVRDVRLALEGDGLAGAPAGSFVVIQELPDGGVIELQFVPLAGGDVALREAFQERDDILGRTLQADWARAVRDVPGGWAVLSGPLTQGELAELLDRAVGPR